MSEISANKFKQNIESEVAKCINNHEILKVTRKDGMDFVVPGAEDWAAIEETIYLNRIPV